MAIYRDDDEQAQNAHPLLGNSNLQKEAETECSSILEMKHFGKCLKFISVQAFLLRVLFL